MPGKPGLSARYFRAVHKPDGTWVNGEWALYHREHSDADGYKVGTFRRADDVLRYAMLEFGVAADQVNITGQDWTNESADLYMRAIYRRERGDA
jgi:hypothetical protein